MTFIIGDIHGEITKLKNLIHNLYLIDKNPKLIFLGDYLNKGENSKKTLEYLTNLNNCIFLMGNHEYYFLQYIKTGKYKEQLQKYAKNSTFVDFKMDFHNIEKKLYFPFSNFFDNLRNFYITQNFFITHSGLNPKFCHKDLNSIPIEEFLFNRYNFISYMKKIQEKITIFGHTGFHYPYYDGYKIGIDTSAVYSKQNPLTAFCLENKQFINDKQEIIYLKNIKLDRCPVIIKKNPYRKANNE